MNYIKSILAVSFILLQSLEIIASTSTKKSQIQAKIASSKAQVKQKMQSKASVAKSSQSLPQASRSHVASAPESPEVTQYIEKFIKDVAAIGCSCGLIKDKDGKSVSEDTTPRCKHDQDHNEKLNAAYQSYKTLHEATHGKGKSIKKEDEKKVRPAINKLFHCKNIKNMAWHPQVHE